MDEMLGIHPEPCGEVAAELRIGSFVAANGLCGAAAKPCTPLAPNRKSILDGPPRGNQGHVTGQGRTAECRKSGIGAAAHASELEVETLG
jgi:hypothetical protein